MPIARRDFLGGLLAVGVLGLLAPVSTSVRAADAPGRELQVFAAASLRDSFTALAAGFERNHPGVKVRLNLAGSQELRMQIEQGASADVFASADVEHMARLRAQQLVEPPLMFAHNEPVIVVGKGNPFGVRELRDLRKVKRLVVGTAEVPIGRYTHQILKRYQASGGAAAADDVKAIGARVVSRELNVRQVLAKVVLGEADAGIVYRSDAAAAAGKVEMVAIDRAANVVAEYPVARLRRSSQPALAEAWIALLRSPEGQRQLSRSGLLPPGPVSAQAPPNPPR
jgi:molybdate transport system substrate-binding protein